MSEFRAGDVVKHEPSGETWSLAVDQFGDEVSPCGWPETIAKASDCTLIKHATDDERSKQLVESSNIRCQLDVRRREATRQIGKQ